MTLRNFSQPSSDAHLIDWLRLIRTDNVGPVTFYKLIDTYGSAGKALDNIPHIQARYKGKKKLTLPSISDIESEIERTHKLGGIFLTTENSSYPLSLSAINDAPPVITALGNVDMISKPSLAIIGARNASINGKKFAYNLARDLGKNGDIIISGLARGIDTAAHEGALDTGTIAVMAGGIDTIYPEENTKLYHRIRDEGVLVSEAPFGTQPLARHFPRRNRIVSGLSKGTIVIEATLKSGSLITARMAADQGRDIYAVPGHPADPRSSGPNALIKDGAVLVRYAADIIAHQESFMQCDLNDVHSAQSPFDNSNYFPPTPTEIDDHMRQIVLENLSYNTTTVDELIRTCDLNSGAMQTILLELELAGQIRRLPGNAITLT